MNCISSDDKFTQIIIIFNYLTEHPEKGLTTLEAVYKLNITNLPKRISEMIAMGYQISKTPEFKLNAAGKVEKRYMRYRRAA